MIVRVVASNDFGEQVRLFLQFEFKRFFRGVSGRCVTTDFDSESALLFNIFTAVVNRIDIFIGKDFHFSGYFCGVSYTATVGLFGRMLNVFCRRLLVVDSINIKCWQT